MMKVMHNQLTLVDGPQTQLLMTCNAAFCTSGSERTSPSATPFTILKGQGQFNYNHQCLISSLCVFSCIYFENLQKDDKGNINHASKTRTIMINVHLMFTHISSNRSLHNFIVSKQDRVRVVGENRVKPSKEIVEKEQNSDISLL